MGMFINKQYSETVNSLIAGANSRLDNPYYKFIGKPTPTTYYNQDKKTSTLDVATGLQYAAAGTESPTKYNKINGMLLFNLEKIQIHLDNSDMGIEADTISGEGYVLPDTITPYPGDYFTIDYVKEKVILQVTYSSLDTLDTGANVWKFSYIVSKIRDDDIKNLNLAGTFEYLIDNQGTDKISIIRSDDYNLLDQMDTIILRLIDFYKRLFFNKRVQTFTFMQYDSYFYDSFLIEFLIRTKIFTNTPDYIYINHELPTFATFPIEYYKDFFKRIEDKNKDKVGTIYRSGYGEYISDKNTTFYVRPENFFSVQHTNSDHLFMKSGLGITLFEEEFISNITTGTLFNTDPLYDIIIKHFNDMPYTLDDLTKLDDIDYEASKKLFYTIPAVVYCLEYFAKTKLLSKSEKI